MEASVRDPELTRILQDAKSAMRQASGPEAALTMVAFAAAEIERRGDDGSDALSDLSDHAIDIHNLDPDAVQAAIARGVDQVLVEHSTMQTRRRRTRTGGAIGQDAAGLRLTADPPPPPLKWLDMSHWDNEPVPSRPWAIPGRVPLLQAGLFSGEGGTGKSLIELHKNVAHVTSKDWLGSLPEQGPAFYIGAEDDEREIHIRLAAIAKHCGITFAELARAGLHVLPLLGRDATLCAASGKSGKVETTALYRQIYEAAGDLKPRNISIDTLSRAFAGSEIDRVQVYGFAMHMQSLAAVAGGSVTVLSHPSLSGMASGSGLSGSTAWHGAFRFRQYLASPKAENGEQPDPDLRELHFLKNQYGPRADTITLRYQNGLFLPLPGVASLDKLAREASADNVFLDLLRRFEREGRNVSQSSGRNYAPALFAKEEEAQRAGLKPKALEAAMRRLFKAETICVEQYGRPSRPNHRLAIKA